jgi:hypothetical protein
MEEVMGPPCDDDDVTDSARAIDAPATPTVADIKADAAANFINSRRCMVSLERGLASRDAPRTEETSYVDGRRSGKLRLKISGIDAIEHTIEKKGFRIGQSATTQSTVGPSILMNQRYLDTGGIDVSYHLAHSPSWLAAPGWTDLPLANYDSSKFSALRSFNELSVVKHPSQFLLGNVYNMNRVIDRHGECN